MIHTPGTSVVRWLTTMSAYALLVAGCGGGGPEQRDGDSPAPKDRTPARTATTQPSGGSAAGSASPRFSLRKVGTFTQPVQVAFPPGDGQMAVVEKGGRLLIADPGNGRVRRTLVDLRGKVSTGSEQGLLGVAFHPQFERSRRLFVNFTDRDGDTRIIEYDAGQRGEEGPATRVREVLRIHQPYTNHNGGNLVFGPDGLLYVGTGDGGGAGDPENRAQDPEELLGKMLRIDVDGARPYAVPADNPFADGGGRPEVWATGLRNPWRYSFDRETGDLYIADVGQNEWEEVHVLAAPIEPGSNLGWDLREAFEVFEAGRKPRGERPVDPVAAYDHESGCSVTGGYVYRGLDVPSLRGWYVFADFCSDWIRGWRVRPGRVDQPLPRARGLSPKGVREFEGVPGISSFGEDADGELYVASLQGGVFRVVQGG